MCLSMLISWIDCICGLLSRLGCWLNRDEERRPIKEQALRWFGKQWGAQTNLLKKKKAKPESTSLCLALLAEDHPSLERPISVILSPHIFATKFLPVCPPHAVFSSCQLVFPSLSPSHFAPLRQKNEGDLFHRLWHVMNEILDLRRQVLVGHLTHDRMRDVKQHITARLDWGNEWVEGGASSLLRHAISTMAARNVCGGVHPRRSCSVVFGLQFFFHVPASWKMSFHVQL